MKVIERAGVEFTFQCIVNENIRNSPEKLNDICRILQEVIDNEINDRFYESFDLIGGSIDFKHGEVTDNENVRIYW